MEYVQHVMALYRSNPKEWKKFAKFERNKYTRNLVDEGNGKFNLMILAWPEGQGSDIHDHPGSHCFMKQLSGTLREIRYIWLSEKQEMKPFKETILYVNDVIYINDSLGLHLVKNGSYSEPAVSLHLYCPPFSQCHVYDQRTGHYSLKDMSF
ncbi:cysteine dioxygenase type 1-like [Tachypleus tridentatus]|uniref:cysteine dioxygenase type 1-like n=1 Tax=Tachypleus tridentatus TaxID=6853 RepID=UPI003FD5C3A7